MKGDVQAGRQTDRQEKTSEQVGMHAGRSCQAGSEADG
jgi:hypothetical protein